MRMAFFVRSVELTANLVRCSRLTGALGLATALLCAPSLAAEAASTVAVGAMPCINPVALGADPTGAKDSTDAVQTAVRDAQWRQGSTAPGIVCLPAGQYKLTRTIAIDRGEVTIEGAGYFETTFLPSGDYGDVFYVAKPRPEPYIFGVNFADFRIFDPSNPTHGAGIHFNQANSSTVTRVKVDGAYGAYDVASSIHLFFEAANSVGNNSNKGSYGYRFHRATSAAPNPSVDLITNSDVGGQGGQSIGYALIINDSDGIQFSNFHFGWSSEAAVLLQPEYDNDVIYGVFFGTGVFDNSRYDIFATARAGFTGAMSLWTFTGVLFETATLDAFYADAPQLSNVTAIGSLFVLNGHSALNISAGSRFRFGQSIFSASNRSNAGASHVVLAGSVSDVNLDGASYSTAQSKHAAPFNVIVRDAADFITARDQAFSGATQSNVQNTSSGRSVHITSASPDH